MADATLADGPNKLGQFFRRSASEETLSSPDSGAAVTPTGGTNASAAARNPVAAHRLRELVTSETSPQFSLFMAQ